MIKDNLNNQLIIAQKQFDVDDLDDTFTNEIKRKTLIAILISITIGNMMVQNLASFLPLFNDSNKWTKVNGVSQGLTTNDLAYITSSFSLA